MYRILAVIIVQVICRPKPVVSDKLTSDRMLSKSVISVLESWLSAVDNRVVVYRGFDVDIPCVVNDKDTDLKQSVISNKSYVWYDTNNNTVHGERLTALSSGALRVGSALPGDTGRYRCVPARQRVREQVHHVVVVFMPTVSVDYRFVYRVPMCDEMRMSQKAEWYGDKAEQENAERTGKEDIELSVSNYSCSAGVDVRGFDMAVRYYTLVISARLNDVARRLVQYKSLLDAASGRCHLKCQLRNVFNTIVNQSRPVIDRWKEMELEDKIYGEERMFYGEMKFPEFMFRPSQLTENVSLYCDTTEYDGGLGYTVLQSTICAPCLPGTLFNPNDNNCTRCPLNTYQDQLAARSCTRCRRNYYTHRVGSNASNQCVYHILAVFARRLPTHFFVVAALILAFLCFNCLYALIVKGRKIATRDGAQLATPRDALASPQQQQLQQQQLGQSGRQVERGDEKRPLLTTAAQQQHQQQQQMQLQQQPDVYP